MTIFAPIPSSTSAGLKARPARDTITIEIPYPPTTGNHQYQSNGRGGRVLKESIKTWRLEVWTAAYKQNAIVRIGEPCAAEYVLHAPDSRRRDLGNAEKVISDALVFCRVLVDDSWIDDLRLRRAPPDPERPRVLVIVRRLP